MLSRKKNKGFEYSSNKKTLANILVIKICFEKNTLPTEICDHNSNNAFSSCLSAIKIAFYQS